MRKAYVIVLAGAALVLGGCSATQVLENMPQSMGGLSSAAPKTPETPYQYPAVHDMPQPRDAKLLSDQEQEKLEKDLLSARESQEKAAAADAEAGQTPPPPPPAQPAKPVKNKKKADDKAASAAKP
jgi:hypothetical protein